MRTRQALDLGPVLRSALGVALILLALATLADTVLTLSGTLQPLNLALTKAVYPLEPGWLTWPMIALTYLGADPPLLIFAALVAFLAWRRGRRLEAAILVGVASTARVVGVAMKFAVAQQRPFFHVPPQPIGVLHGYGYPSGHALLSMAILGSCAVALRRLLKRRRRCRVVLILSVLLILGIGASRVYLGVHWVNDVAGGYLFGSLIAVLGGVIERTLAPRLPPHGG